MTPRSRLALTVLVVLLAAAGAAPAVAGEYPVFACEPGAGDVNRSWVAERNHGGVEAGALCPPPGGETRNWNRGLVVRNKWVPENPHATIPTGSWGALIFRAPPGTSLSRISYTHDACGWSGFSGGIMNGAGAWLRRTGPNVCGVWFGPHETLPLGGTHEVKLVVACVQGPCAAGGNVPRAWSTFRSATVWVADHSQPAVKLTGGSAVAYGWRRGSIEALFSAWDNVGIAHAQIRLGNRIEDTAASVCDHTYAVPCPNMASRMTVQSRSVPDGYHYLTVVAVDAAGNIGADRKGIFIDNTPPTAPQSLSLAGSSSWRSQNSFEITWRNPPQTGTAPIAGAEIAICPAANGPDVWTGCARGSVNQRSATTMSNVRVPREGQWVGRVWLRDAAGNHDPRTAQAVPLNLDATPPTLSFGAQDPNDPTRVDVQASDAVSPLSRTELEIRRRGSSVWAPVAVTRTATGFSGHLDDEKLADGLYDLRARAFDSAGNERSTDRDATGALVTRKVPLRINTRLVAGQVKRVSARRSRGKKRKTRRVIVVRPRVRYGRTIPIRGRLTTPGGNPVASSNIEVWERTALPGAAWRRVALIDTNADGRFRFKALRGPSRTLRFRYAGTPIVRARTAEVTIRVEATTSMRPNRRRVVNGDEIRFRGRVRGRPLPSTGKLVQLQVYSRGTWLTFATPRASARSGRWRYRYRFTATRGTVRYRFRARLPQEARYPYEAGTSRPVGVTVRGL
jgi:hypothetical protein